MVFLQRYLRNLFRVMLLSSGSPLRTDADGFHLTKHAICEFSPFFKKGVFEYSSHGTGWSNCEASEILSKSEQNKQTARCLFVSWENHLRRSKKEKLAGQFPLHPPVILRDEDLQAATCCPTLSGNFIMNIKIGNVSFLHYISSHN